MVPYLTERMLQQSPTLAPLGALAAQHCERMDGSGYPRGLRGAAIPIAARVLAVAAAYSAMTTRRPYRPALAQRASCHRGASFEQWLDAFTAALPAREKYSKIVGLWQTEAGQPNEVCHIWAYPSLNARVEARANAMKDPAWQEFLGKGGAYLDEMHSTIMLPAPHSPLK